MTDEEIAHLRSYLAAQSMRRTPVQILEALQEAYRQFREAILALSETAYEARLDEQSWQAGDTTNYDIELTLRTKERPYTVVVSYSGSKEKNVEGFDTPWMFRDVPDVPSMFKRADNTKRINWYSFPDTVITIPVKFQTISNDSVKEKIEVTFDTLAYPMKFRRELTYFIPRTKYVANWIYKK